MYALGFCIFGPECRYNHTRKPGPPPDPSTVEAAKPKAFRDINRVVNAVNEDVANDGPVKRPRYVTNPIIVLQPQTAFCHAQCPPHTAACSLDSPIPTMKHPPTLTPALTSVCISAGYRTLLSPYPCLNSLQQRISPAQRSGPKLHHPIPLEMGRQGCSMGSCMAWGTPGGQCHRQGPRQMGFRTTWGCSGHRGPWVQCRGGRPGEGSRGTWGAQGRTIGRLRAA